MLESDVIDIQCHTYDMHRWTPSSFETEETRANTLPLKGETSEEYALALKTDIEKFASVSTENISVCPTVIAYPSGLYTQLTEDVVHSLGIKISLSTNAHSNTITLGVPESLYALGRYTITDNLSAEELLSLIES